MKKILALFLVLASVFSLCACGAVYYTQSELDEAVEEAYEEGYERGKSYGWDSGYEEGLGDATSGFNLEDIYYEIDSALEKVNRAESALEECLNVIYADGASLASFLREYFSGEDWCYGSDSELIERFLSHLYFELENASCEIYNSNEKIWLYLNR